MDSNFKPRRIVAIGDCHGNYKELIALYQQLLDNAFDPNLDQLVMLGDMVDRGPDTKKVIDQCIQWQKDYPHFIFLYGNHEDMMLDALSLKHPIYGDYYIWWNQGGKETLKSYQPEGTTDFEKAIMQPKKLLGKKHLTWIANLPYLYETPDYIFVHAGLPSEPLADIRKKLSEGNHELIQKIIWAREDFIYSPFDWGKKIIYGHNPTVEPLVGNDRIGLNTLSRKGGKLTALEIPSMRFFFQPML